MNIGKEITAARKSVLIDGQKVSQKRLAFMVNVKPVHISKIESGKNGVSIQLLEKIAKALELNLIITFTQNDSKRR